jgi:hypothetical protein
MPCGSFGYCGEDTKWRVCKGCGRHEWVCTNVLWLFCFYPPFNLLHRLKKKWILIMLPFVLCILYYTTLALHVLDAICTHHQEHKLQSTAVGTHDCYGVLEVGKSIGAGCGWDTLTLTAWSDDPPTTSSNGLPNFQHTITITCTYGCSLQFVLLMMGANSTRNM